MKEIVDHATNSLMYFSRLYKVVPHLDSNCQEYTHVGINSKAVILALYTSNGKMFSIQETYE